MFKTSLEELKNLNTTLRDEYTALQLAFTSLEAKLRGVQVSKKKKSFSVIRRYLTLITAKIRLSLLPTLFNWP